MLLSRLVYECKRGRCNATYYGKTKRHFTVRICEHLDISRLTGKKVKIDNSKLKAIEESFLRYNRSPFFRGFYILTRESNDFRLKIIESLLNNYAWQVCFYQSRFIIHYLSSYFHITVFYHIIWCSSIPLWV